MGTMNFNDLPVIFISDGTSEAEIPVEVFDRIWKEKNMIYRVELCRQWNDITFDFDDAAVAMVFAETAVQNYSRCDANEHVPFTASITVINEGGKDETSDSDSAETESTEESV